MNEFAFDKTLHRYTLNGSELISVTKALNLAGLIDDRWFTDEARDRGRAVHDAVLFHIQDDLVYESISPIALPYFKAFLKCEKEENLKYIINLCEKPQYSLEPLYSGMPDIICYSRGRPWQLEMKTGSWETAAYQTAAYDHFDDIRYLFAQRFCLRLFPDETYKLIRFTDPNDFNVFCSALNIAKLKFRPTLIDLN